MAVFINGWEAGDKTYYQARGWTYSIVANVAITTTVGEVHKSITGNGGTYALFSSTSNITSPITGVSSPSGRWLHFWYHPRTSAATNEFSMTFVRGSTDQWTLNLYLEGAMDFRRGGPSGAFVSAGSTGWVSRTDHWFAIFLNAKNAGGSCEVWIDDVQVFTFSGDTVFSASNEDWDQFSFRSVDNICIDDVIITTAAEGRLTEHYNKDLHPTANDAVTLTPSAGTNYENVDEIPPSTTDYNSTTTSGEDTYVLSNLGWTPPSVHTVMVQAYCTREGSIVDVELVAKPTTTSFYSSNQAIPAAGSYGVVDNLWNTNPDTAVAWTPTDVDGLKAGVRF